MSPTDKEKFILKTSSRLHQLEELSIHSSSSTLTDIEQKVIQFIKDWLDSNEQIFQKTSGSTGPPKHIGILKQQMSASAEATIKALNISKGDAALLNIHPDFIGGKMMIVRALTHQLKLIVGEVTANPLESLPLNERIDFFSFVPYQLQQILITTPERIVQLNNAKAIIIGGAPVSDSLHQLIKEQLSTDCYSTYGMTETVSHIALKKLNNIGPQDKPHFKAIEGATFSVDDDNRLIIHAYPITRLQDLLTNDVVSLISPTEFEWLGRFDFVINSGGIKIHAEQLEKDIALLFSQAAISNQFFIFGKAHEAWGEQVTLLIEGNIAKVNVEDLLESLPTKKRPKEVYYLDRFSYTKNDKLDRLACIKAALRA